MLIFFLFCFIYTQKKTDNNELCYHKFYAAKAKKNSWKKKNTKN